MRWFNLIAGILWAAMTVIYIVTPDVKHAPMWAYSALLAVLYFSRTFQDSRS
jgi:uncharacterized membrane protein YcaP (DUF421 family)